MKLLILIGKFLGIGVASIILIILIAVAVIYFMINRYMKKATGQGLFKLLKDASRPAIFTPRIHLIPVEEKWNKPKQIKAQIAEARSLGFASLGAFAVEEMDGMIACTMVDQTQTMLLVIYDHEKVPQVYFDLVICSQKGEHYCYSTSKSPSLPEPPKSHTLRKPDGSLSEAVTLLRSQIPADSRMTINHSNCFSIIEQAYADCMDYLIHLDFVSEENIRQSGDAFGLDHRNAAAKKVKEVADLTRAGYRDAIPEVVLEHFLKQSNLTATQWNEYEDNVLVIHERQEVDELWNTYFEHYFIRAEYNQKKMIKHPLINRKNLNLLEQVREKFKTDPVAYFHHMNNTLPVKEQFKVLGAIDYPIKAVVYQPSDYSPS